MSKYLFLLTFIIGSCQTTEVPISKNQDIIVVFYNVENLFDIYNDPKTKDEEYTPSSPKKWDQKKYQKKLENLARVILSSSFGEPDIIGLAEIENKRVLEDLINSGYLGHKDFGIVHKDSEDRRGIDVALLYNKRKLPDPESSFSQPLYDNGSKVDTRLILQSIFLIDGEEFTFLVNHWPSRAGDYKKKERARIASALGVRKKIDQLLSENNESKIIIMGDFNDYPGDKSIFKVLKADRDGKSDLINLMWRFEDNDEGTYNYKEDWGCLDQFIVSQSLLNQELNHYTSYSQVEILKHKWLLYKNSEGIYYPDRTYGGDKYFGGYSDHLAISMLLSAQN